MNPPGAERFWRALDATWPPAATLALGPWTLRRGAGGGKRVSAATANGPASVGDILAAETAMRSFGQAPMFMIREGDGDLDLALARRGYRLVDPVTLYSCPIGTLTAEPPPPVSGFAIWPPLRIMRDIWAAGGIGAARLAVMGRAAGPRTAILARAGDRAAGCGFVAVHSQIAMIHAIEVLGTLRRLGAGGNILRHAAIWAQDQGASTFSLFVTDANGPANRLYVKLGMSVEGHYHYRVHEKQG